MKNYVRWVKSGTTIKPYLDLAEISPRKILTKSGNKTYRLNLAYPGETVITAITKDKHKKFYSKSAITIPKNYICLWYKWPSGGNQYQKSNTGWRFKYLLVPQYLPLTELTLNALGLLQAEMTKHSRRACSIIFTNGESGLNNIVMKFFKFFGVEFEEWGWDITFNFKLKEREIPEKTKEREQLAKQFWLKHTRISNQRKHNKFIAYTGNKKYKNMRADTNVLGNLRIVHADIILYQLSLELLEKIKKIILSLSAQFTSYYLQGLAAGEANVKLTKLGSIDSVRIGCVDYREKQVYSKCLNKLGITSQIETNYLTINNQRNFIKVYKHCLLKLHPKRHKKFLKGMARFERIPTEIKKEFEEFRKDLKKETLKIVEHGNNLV